MRGDLGNSIDRLAEFIHNGSADSDTFHADSDGFLGGIGKISAENPRSQQRCGEQKEKKGTIFFLHGISFLLRLKMAGKPGKTVRRGKRGRKKSRTQKRLLFFLPVIGETKKG